MLVTLLILIVTIVLILTPIVLLLIRQFSKTKSLMEKKQLELQEKKNLEKQEVKEEVKQKSSLLEVMKQKENENTLSIEVNKNEEVQEKIHDEIVEPIKVTANNVEITDDDFQLVQAEAKIYDEKLDTKATTFMKDAFRRFCKNKSSVVGAAIIGLIILLSIIVPIASPYDVEKTEINTTFLPAKLFNNANGFWDGTKKYTNVVYDNANEEPADYKGSCVVKIYDKRIEYTDAYNKYAKGGILIFANTYSKGNEKTTVAALYHNKKVNFKDSDNVKVTIKIAELDTVKNYKIGEYRILLTDEDNKTIVLRDWNDNAGEFVIDISEKLKENNLEYINGRLRIELKQNDYETINNQAVGQSFIGIETIVFESTNEQMSESFSNISITDANDTVGITKESNLNKYWPSTGTKSVYHAEITYVDFLYDWYTAKLGLISTKVGKSDMDTYVKNGWCTFDYEWNKTTKSYDVTFEKLSDECPVEKITYLEYFDEFDTYELTADVIEYKLLGYKKMPKFLLGTDNSGYDLITLCFKGLRTSLIIAFVSSAVCFIFGLCWGAISGYFGGNVDLIMERFCDILGGIPWIVMMTLAILLLGNNIVTFALALCLTGWMGTAARTRTQFYRFKGREYILASRTLGAGDFRLIFKHILPNAMGTIITSSVLMIPSTIFSETTLSYLNLGLQGSNSFGNILSRNQQYISNYPILIIFPAIIISLIMISFNLFGNGLRDAFNPSLKGSE